MDSRYFFYNLIKPKKYNLKKKGIKPIPESFKEWEITPDINLSNNTDIKVTSTGESTDLKFLFKSHSQLFSFFLKFYKKLATWKGF